MKKIPFIIFCLGYAVVLIVQFALLRYPEADLATFIPGPAFLDFLILATLQPLYIIGIYYLVVSPMTQVYYWLHDLIHFFKYEYKKVELGTEYSTFSYLSRLAVPALLCYSLLFLFVDFLLPSGLFTVSRENFVIPIIALNFLLLPVSCLAVSGSWVLDDIGVICHLKKKYYDDRKPPVIEGVGRYWGSTWSGLIGYTTPIGIAVQIYRSIVLSIPLQATVTLILLPLVLICMFIPVILIHDEKIEHYKEKFFNKWNLETVPKTTLEI
ncbi:MAG: hypothetical protein ACFFCM_14400 [Promethearchaeota archaeon]